ncbi:MAG: YoaK family protein [Catonella sp.]|uniref:YoaK family protein n=1 Tax=Catonella sp. TaxID=2382125 RepID=UPI003FA13979
MENMTEKQEEVLHHIMCISGGFMGGYALFSRLGNFGSAQTANLIEIILNIFGRDYKEVSFRLMALLLYILANVMGAILKHKFGMQFLKEYVFFVLFIGFVISSFLPENLEPILGLLPIFFMSSTQWNAFSGTRKYNCSTIFSTNNLKQMVLGYTYYCLTGKKEDREKGRFYLVSLGFFYLGVVIAVLLCTNFGVKASFFGIIIIIFARKLNRKLNY